MLKPNFVGGRNIGMLYARHRAYPILSFTLVAYPYHFFPGFISYSTLFLINKLRCEEASTLEVKKGACLTKAYYCTLVIQNILLWYLQALSDLTNPLTNAYAFSLHITIPSPHRLRIDQRNMWRRLWPTPSRGLRHTPLQHE